VVDPNLKSVNECSNTITRNTLKMEQMRREVLQLQVCFSITSLWSVVCDQLRIPETMSASDGRDALGGIAPAGR